MSNGAKTAAFGELYNDALHEGMEAVQKMQKEFNIDKAVETLDAKAGAKSHGKCATNVREALEAGGLDTEGHSRDAKKYGPLLTREGFDTVSQNDYSALKGDIAVIQPAVGGNPAGHIQMYNGAQWVSDFKQNGFWPGQSYRQNQPDFTIYRWDK